MKLKPSLFPAILLLAVLAVQLLPGCAPSPERSRLELIETIIDEHPDSAMTLLDSIDTAALRSDRDRALYGMLLTEALDKTHRNPANDSLITTAIDYFADKGDRRREMIATYYGARVQYLNNDFSHAIVRFFRAKEIAEELGEHFWHGMAARGISDIFTDSYAHGESLKYAEEEFENFQKSGRQPYLNWALLDLALSHYNYGNHENAIRLANELLDSAQTSKSIYLEKHAKVIVGLTKITSGEFEDAIDIFSKICQLEIAEPIDSSYLCSALVGNKEYDKALTLLNQISLKDEIIEASVNFEAMKANSNYKGAISWMEKLYHINAKEYKEKIRTNFSNSAVDYFKQEKLISDHLLSKSKTIYILTISLIILILFIIVFSAIAIINRKKNLISEKVILAEQLKESLVSSLQQLEKFNKELGQTNNKLAHQIETKFKLISDSLSISTVNNNDIDKNRVAKDITALIKKLTSDGSDFLYLENHIDSTHGFIVKNFRDEFPNLKEDDYRLFLFSIIGFSNPLIALLLGYSKVNTVYDRRRHLKDKIKMSASVKKELYLGYL